jgi:hypothetical protein
MPHDLVHQFARLAGDGSVVAVAVKPRPQPEQLPVDVVTGDAARLR